MTSAALAAAPPTSRLLHAAQQLVWHLRAREPLAPPAWLTPAEVALFDRMAPADQFEGLAVVATLEAEGWAHDRELLLAGLLHDAGKSLAPPAAGYRILVTLLEELAPPLLAFLAARSQPLGMLRNHASGGAAMASESGLAPDVVRLIADHHQPPNDARMAALQRADALH